MTTGKIERCAEKFETSSDNIPHLITVNNYRREGHVMLRAAVASGHGSGWSQVYLTPDEADQLAEMLRLSALSLRGETGTNWKEVHSASIAYKQAHDAEVRRVLEAAGVDSNTIYDAFHNASIVGRNAARELLDRKNSK